MQFGSRQKRNLISRSVLGLVPDVIIAIVAASMTDSGLMGFFVTLIGLQVLYFLIWAKNAIWGWLLFWLRGRKQMAELFSTISAPTHFPSLTNIKMTCRPISKA
jgi:hypothetical protein